MAVDVNSITCPQCGATDVEMTSDKHGVCKSCGAKFSVSPRIDTQNIFNEVHVHATTTEKEEDPVPCLKYVINPEFTKEDFIRKVWIDMAKYDAPLDVFSLDFSDTTLLNYQVLTESVMAEVSWQASIGDNREEKYTDYETYYEEIPIDRKETYYENGVRRERLVRDTKRVEKERPIDCYRTVTDWRTQTGQYSISSDITIDNTNELSLENSSFSSYDFNECLNGTKQTSVIKAPAEIADSMLLLKSTESRAMTEHRENIGRRVRYKLPGDKQKDWDWDLISMETTSRKLYQVPQYIASFIFKGKTYTRSAFPFGSMNIIGDKVENEVSLKEIIRGKREEEEQEIKKKQDIAKRKNSERRSRIDGNVAKATSGISIITILALVASIFISCFIRNLSLNLIFFGISQLAFIVNRIIVNKVSLKEDRKAEQEIRARNQVLKNEIEAYSNKVQSEIYGYSTNYKIKQIESLNSKLVSLGLTPVTEDEF